MSLHVKNDPCRCDVCGLENVISSLRSSTPIVAESPAIRAVFLRLADFAPPGGESTRQFHTRVLQAVKELAALGAGQGG